MSFRFYISSSSSCLRICQVNSFCWLSSELTQEEKRKVPDGLQKHFLRILYKKNPTPALLFFLSLGPQHFQGDLQCFYQGIDVGLVVVDIQGSSARRRGLKHLPVQRLGAVVARAHRHPLLRGRQKKRGVRKERGKKNVVKL